MDLLTLLNVLLLIAGGILAASGVIIAKKPNAKDLIDKIVPYQAFIGVGLLGLGVLNLLRSLGGLSAGLRLVPVATIIWLAMVVTSILLGFMFGMPQIAKWMPGDGGAEQKGMELAKKLAPFQVVLGIVGVVAALLVLLRIG